MKMFLIVLVLLNNNNPPFFFLLVLPIYWLLDLNIGAFLIKCSSTSGNSINTIKICLFTIFCCPNFALCFLGVAFLGCNQLRTPAVDDGILKRP